MKAALTIQLLKAAAWIIATLLPVVYGFRHVAFLHSLTVCLIVLYTVFVVDGILMHGRNFFTNSLIVVTIWLALLASLLYAFGYLLGIIL